eukprot:967238-Amphidinium_carterae.1
MRQAHHCAKCRVAFASSVDVQGHMQLFGADIALCVKNPCAPVRVSSSSLVHVSMPRGVGSR